MATLNLNTEKIDKLYIGGQLICGGNNGYVKGDIIPPGGIKEVYQTNEEKTEIWNKQLENNIIRSLVVDDEFNFYTAGDNRILNKFDKNGHKIWEYRGLVGDVKGISVDSAKNVYVVCGLTVTKINKDGGEVWKLNNFSQNLSSVNVDKNDNVFISGNDKTLRKLNKDGQEIWKYTGQTEIKNIKFDNDDIYISEYNTIKKINKDGQEVWKHKISSGGLESLDVDSEHIYYCNNDKLLVKMNKDGQEIWRVRDFPYDNDAVIIGENGHLFILNRRALYEYDENGRRVKGYLNNLYMVAFTVDNKQNIYVALSDKTVRKIGGKEEFLGFEILKDKGDK